MKVKFGGREIGDGEPCFITFEAGATHDGYETASALVKAAAEGGGDAVKLQMIDPDRLVADKSNIYTYKILADRRTGATGTISEPQYDILRRRALLPDDWRKLKAQADDLGLAFFVTVFWEDEVDLAAELGCHSLKIAGGDVNNHPLIRYAARSGLSVQLDTGNADLGEIEAAVDVILSEGNDKIIIHQCPSGYPARLESVNLRIIQTLKQMFPFPAAFSDHSPGFEMDVAAVAMGANMVEKTITLDRATPSVEHIMSLEPHEMKDFVKTIRDVETALGSPRRTFTDAEQATRHQFRRCAYLESEVKSGRKLSEAKVVFRRPGDGIGGDLYETLLGQEFSDDFPAGHKLSLSDFV